jgi:DNA (cytosine-5)-methyltransferase 1
MSILRFGSLFAGIGGLDLGLERAGMECRWQVEIDPFCQKVLAKHWPKVKRYDDIRTVNGAELEPVDLICGGSPCQDISTAGKGIGIIGSRSGLWTEFARLVREIRPQFVFAENVTALRNRGLALVLQDLREIGFDAEWHCIPASSFGAPHQRDRIWIVAYREGRFQRAIIRGNPKRDIQAHAADVDSIVRDHGRCGEPGSAQTPGTQCVSVRQGLLRGEKAADTYSEPLVRAAIARGERHAWTSEPGVVRTFHGFSAELDGCLNGTDWSDGWEHGVPCMARSVPNRVNRIKSLGNSVVPQVAQWLGHRIMESAQ